MILGVRQMRPLDPSDSQDLAAIASLRLVNRLERIQGIEYRDTSVMRPQATSMRPSATGVCGLIHQVLRYCIRNPRPCIHYIHVQRCMSVGKHIRHCG